MKNRNCVQKRASVEARYTNFQKNNPYSNPYNPGQKDHPYIKWSNNQILNANLGETQVPHAPQKKPSPIDQLYKIHSNKLERVREQYLKPKYK